MRKVEFGDENSIIVHAKRPRPFTPLQSRPPLRLVSINNKQAIIDDSDMQDGTNPKTIGYYAGEIYENLLKTETEALPEASYMQDQPDINYKMRAILIDWIVGVHFKFKLLSETLFLCVNLIDRYLSKKEVERKYLQLIGVCALMVASKYEEIYPPQLKDFIYVTDKAYTPEQLIKMEIDMLGTLKFNITVPCSFNFFERWAKVAALQLKAQFLGKYLCELALVEYHMLKYKPSILSLAAIYLSIKILKFESLWTGKMIKLAKCTESDIKICARELLSLFYSASSHTLTSVKDKYSKKDFLEVSKIKLI
jgi:G2/mitotic-specific cyclin-B, other